MRDFFSARNPVLFIAPLAFCVFFLSVTVLITVNFSHNTKTFAADTALNIGSLTVKWNRPTGYVSVVGPSYSNNSTNVTAYCSSTGTSCSIPAYTFQPGADLIYTVKVNGSSGAVIKDSTTSPGLKSVLCYCNTAGSVTVNWDWNYAVAVYPDANANCLTVVADCKTKTLSDNGSPLSVTFDQLKEGTNYHEYVCSPDCSASGTKIVDLTAYPDLPAKQAILGAVTSSCGSGTAPNNMNVAFKWTPASGITFSNQYLDFSLNSGFSSGYTQEKPISATQTSLNLTNFAQSTIYYWRIRSDISGVGSLYSLTQAFGVAGCVTSSATVDRDHDGFKDDLEIKIGTDAFHACGIDSWPPDLDNDGTVGIGTDAVMLQSKIGQPYNPRYDLNGDGFVSNQDAQIVASYAGKSCSQMTGMATPQKVNVRLASAGGSYGPTINGQIQTCNNNSPVAVLFSWNAIPNTTQTIYFAANITQLLNENPAGTKGVDQNKNFYTMTGLGQNAPLAWEVKATDTNGNTFVSSPVSFTTLSCVPIEITSPTTMRHWVPDCSDGGYTTLLGWNSDGNYEIDISSDGQFGQYASLNTNGATVIAAPTGFSYAGVPYQFFNGKTYYWRIVYNGVPYYERNANGTFNNFFVVNRTCTPGTGNISVQLRTYIHQIADGLPPIDLWSGAKGVDPGAVTYGIAGCETSGNFDPSTHEEVHDWGGLFQFSQSTFLSNATAAGFNYSADADRFDGFKSAQVALYMVTHGSAKAWQYCTDGSSSNREWSDYTGPGKY